MNYTLSIPLFFLTYALFCLHAFSEEPPKLRKEVRASMHESQDNPTLFDRSIANGSDCYQYKATISSGSKTWEYAKVSPLDSEMNWLPQTISTNNSFFIFHGNIIPGFEKSAFYSKFKGKMYPVIAHGVIIPDLEWDFYGKLQATANLKAVDSHQPWNYGKMDMEGKAFYNDANNTLVLGVLSDNRAVIRIEGIPLNTTYTYSFQPNQNTTNNTISFDSPTIVVNSVIGTSPVETTLKVFDSSNKEIEKWNITILPRLYLQGCYATLYGGSGFQWGLYPTAGFLLGEFINANICSMNNYSVNTTYELGVHSKELTHNCGAIFDNSGIASIPHYIFNDQSIPSIEITEDNMKNVFAQKVQEIAQNMSDEKKALLRQATDTAEVSWKDQFSAIAFEKDFSSDLYYAFHYVSSDYKDIKYTFEKISDTQFASSYIQIVATIKDLYDFDFTDSSSIVKNAAALQIGQGKISGDESGKIFYITVKCNVDQPTDTKSTGSYPTFLPKQIFSAYHVIINL